jgi:integrase
MTLYKTAYGWRYHFQMNGERFSKSGFDTKKVAASAEAERKKQVKKQARQIIRDTDFKSVAYDYLDLAIRKFADKTYKQKAFVCKSFIEHVGNLPIELITAAHIHDYLNTRPTNNNYNAHRKDLCTVFTHGMKVMKIIRYNPCWDLDKMPHTPEEKLIPTEEDILKLILAADPATDEKDLILTLIHLVARIDEVLRLTWRDVNFTKRMVKKWTRKRSSGAYESVTVYMNKDLHTILKKRWDNRESEKWVFFNPKTGDRFKHRPKLMQGLCKRAEIEPPFGFHKIRHFVASYLADTEKISKKAIGGLLGHKALQTTEIYLHSVDGSEQDAVSRLSGKFS